MLQILPVAKPFPDSLLIFVYILAVAVARGRPRQPAISVGAMYSSMTFCAGVSHGTFDGKRGLCIHDNKFEVQNVSMYALTVPTVTLDADNMQQNTTVRVIC